MKDLHCPIWPPRRAFIPALRLIELLDLFLEHGENAAGRIARFERVSEWVRKKILLCMCCSLLKQYRGETPQKRHVSAGEKINQGWRKTKTKLKYVI